MKKLILGMAVVAMTVMSCKDAGKKENENMEGDGDQVAMDNEDAMMAEDESMDKGETVADIAMANDNFSTLETAVQAAGLEETLQGDGPFTVFAPTNDAFAKLPAGTVDDLVKPENKDKLTGILTYHVVPGEFMAADVVKAIKDNNGKYEIKTVAGGMLTATMEGDKVMLKDANGGTVNVVMTDVKGSNGVIHAVDGVLMPKG